MSTVFAVMKATIEIPVRSSNGGETLDQLLKAAKDEAEGKLRNKYPDLRIVGQVEFSHAIVRETT